MRIKVTINGFGRFGYLLYRATTERKVGLLNLSQKHLRPAFPFISMKALE